MVSPVTAELREELDAALGVLEPQIKGLQDLMLIPLSEPTMNSVREEHADHVRRRDLCMSVLTTLTSLEDDDYPDMPKRVMTPSSYSELREQYASITAALSEFDSEPVAEQVSISLGTPTDK